MAIGICWRSLSQRKHENLYILFDPRPELFDVQDFYRTNALKKQWKGMNGCVL